MPPKVVEYGVEKERPEGMERDTAVEDMVVAQRSRLQKLVKYRGGSNASWRGSGSNAGVGVSRPYGSGGSVCR